MSENDSPKKNSESIYIKIRKRSTKEDHAYFFIPTYNIPLIDLYDNIIKKCKEKSQKIDGYHYTLYVIKNTHENLSNKNEFIIYNEEDWKDFISLNIYNSYLESKKIIKIEYLIKNLKKENIDRPYYFLHNAYEKKFQCILNDIPNDTFILALKDFIINENLMDKCLSFLENNLIKTKKYDIKDLEIKIKEKNIPQIDIFLPDNLKKYNKNEMKNIFCKKINDLSNQIESFKDFEDSIIDLNKKIDLNINKDLEEKIFNTINNNINKDFNFDNDFPSFVKIYSEKGDFHETLVRETMELQNNNNQSIYMSNTVNQE